MAGRRLRLSKLYSFSCFGPSPVSESLGIQGTPGFNRVVHCNQSDKHKVKPFKYRSNYVSTTKYTLITFLPKALFEQFRRVANLYFLFAAALSLTPLAPFTASSLIAPLVFVVGVSMIKEGVEDWRRFMQDQEVNKRAVLVHVGQGIFKHRQWKQLRVGDVVKVMKDSFFPSDLLLLSSTFPDGICYVETSNLDGETNLKLKKCVERTLELNEDVEFGSFVAKVRCEDPNPHLYTFVGNLDIGGGHDIVPLTAQQLLLRDSKLRNTEHVYGVVIFSGHDTKVMQNARKAPSKRSRIERKMDKIIYLLFTVLIVISLFGSIAFGVMTKYKMPRWWYLKPNDVDVYYDPKRSCSAALLHFITALMLYGYLIPISLYVSIEIVKVLQALFINNDIAMYDELSNTPAHARTSNLNEELGQVDTILSDKTGTLTCNVMEFRKCSIAGVSYGRGITEVERATAKRLGRGLPDSFHDVTPPDASPGPNGMIEMSDVPPRLKGFNFNDERIMATNWLRQPNANVIRTFFRVLAVCHTVIPEESMGEVTYQAEAPDELAFVVAARELGFEFSKRSQNSVLVWEPDDNGNRVQREYKVLNLLEFNSTRKRMSVIVRDEGDDIYVFSKGADSVMFERLSKNGRQFEPPTRAHLSDYAEAGLRTLVLAYRKLEEAEYKDWNATFLKAKTTIGTNRDALLESACDLMERDLILLGSTAVEDKLQKGVPECIDRLAQAGLKIWVLTGDKLETAINIGFACSLLRQGMKQIVITLDNGDVKHAEQFGNKEAVAKASMESIGQQLANAQQQIDLETDEDAAFALIIDGKALGYALEDTVKEKLLRLAINCASVICCRVSPKQKAQVTQLVKEGTGRTTLSIGDGANDVGMIQEADIGVGISGLEGMQAVMASDFSIAQFRFLERLLIVHGHWCYKRIAQMICYFFYKNITFGMTLFYFEAFTTFSGQTAYNDWYMSLFNVFFTSLPVIALGVFEQDVSARVCLMFPTLYQQGPKNLFFSWSRILGWMANGVYSSLVTFFFVTCIFEHQAYRKGGQNSELAILGAVMYTCVVWTVNCQVALALSYFTWIQHFVIWGSVGMWYIFLLIYGAITPVFSTTAYQVLIEALGPAPYYWLTTLLVPMACVLPYFVYLSFQRSFWPMDHHIIQEIRHQQRDFTDPEMWRRERAKAIERTSIGLSARVEARIRQLRNSRLSPRR